jgi:gliding-associated putative ABC transporter substrate-binding component GldG
LLEEFRRYGGHRVTYEFVNPLAGLPDSLQVKVKDSLTAMGIMPYNVKAQQDISQGVSVQLIFPGALVDYHGHELAVNLLQPQPGMDPLQTLNHSAALLEYDFVHAIEQLSWQQPPLVAYMLGNEENLSPEVYDALNVLQQNYRLDTLNLATTPSISPKYQALIFMKPGKRFSEEEKLKIDQYVMHGGKILWCIDPVVASMDSLQHQSSFLAYDQGLNLGDLQFNYGVRVNPDLVQDLQCFSIPVTVGHIGNRPQIERLPWPYAPLFTPGQDHPITKNMDVVLGHFASSIDTTKAAGIRKTVLLSTSENSRTLGTPLRVSLESVKVKPDPREFIKKHLPVAVLLEGDFPSVFRNRLNADMRAKIELRFHEPYKPLSIPTRMIVVSDGNMFLNPVSRQDGPLAMGMDPYTRQLFANREFFENCLTYLTDTTGIIQARNKDFKLRLLDKTKVEQHKATWQVLGFLIPLAFVLLVAAVFQFVRQRKYTGA